MVAQRCSSRRHALSDTAPPRPRMAANTLRRDERLVLRCDPQLRRRGSLSAHQSGSSPRSRRYASVFAACSHCDPLEPQNFQRTLQTVGALPGRLEITKIAQPLMPAGERLVSMSVVVQTVAISIMLVGVAVLGLSPLFALVSIVATPPHRWAAIGRRKVAWAIACWLTGPFASIPYLTQIRPQLRDASS